MGSAAQVTQESGAPCIAALDLISPDDIFGADSDLQRAVVLNRYGTFGACAIGYHPFATNCPNVHTISGSLPLSGGVSQVRE